MDIWKAFEQNVISHSAAHHLMAIDDLIERLGYARVSDIARQLNITRGSVSITLRPLKKAGLVEQDENRHLRLSEPGRNLVSAIKTKRHLIQRFLSDVLSVAPEQAEIDACKLEHLVSNSTAQRLLSFLRFLEADQDCVHEFIEKWSAHESACNRTPGTCPSCRDECLSENLRPAPETSE